MKRTLKQLVGFALFLSLSGVWIYSCDTPTENDGTVTFSARQTSGCVRGVKGAKKTECISYFNYSFKDTLKVDFMVWGNCCPDSNRFVTTCEVSDGVISAEVTDTAKLGCYYNCNYIVHLDISGLKKDMYLFRLDYPGQVEGDTIKYREIVERE